MDVSGPTIHFNEEKNTDIYILYMSIEVKGGSVETSSDVTILTGKMSQDL